MPRPHRTAALVGKTFAHAQHMIDKTIAWGFRRMRSAGDTKEIALDDRRMRARAKNVGRKVFGFIGAAGEAFYSEYDKLKK